MFLQLEWPSKTSALMRSHFGAGSRTAEDYAVVYFGSSIFKITRLIVIAVFSVHFFACSFYKAVPIKGSGSSQPAACLDFFPFAFSSLKLPSWILLSFPPFSVYCLSFSIRLVFASFTHPRRLLVRLGEGSNKAERSGIFRPQHCSILLPNIHAPTQLADQANICCESGRRDELLRFEGHQPLGSTSHLPS